MKPLVLVLLAEVSLAQVVPDHLIRDILSEISAGNALEHTRALAARVRYPNSAAFFEAAEYVAAQARAYGLENVRIERFEMNRPSWDPVEGELDLIEPERRRLASLLDTPLLVAQYSHDGELTAEVVDVGVGDKQSDYEGKDIHGRIILATGRPADVWKAMGNRGAAGLLSAARASFFGRQTSPDAVAWGRAPSNALVMMISPDQGEELRRMLHRGKTVKIRMRVRGMQSEPGATGMVMGEIPGAIKDQDVVLVSHLDHQKPGANDNASGSGVLLEVLAVLSRLRAAEKIPALRRTVRFWWSTEIRSEWEYFRRSPEQAKKILLAVNLDQAGGDRNAENNFIVINGPDWLPSYADDLIHDLAEHMKDNYAPAEHAPSPLFVAPNGSQQSFRTVYWDYAPLSDHVAFSARQVGIPCISVAVPSLHVIHTSQDTSDRLDPTWLKRSALMMLAPTLFAANAGPPNNDAGALLDLVSRRGRVRLVQAEDPKAQLAMEEQRLDSVRAFDPEIRTESFKKKLRALVEVLSVN
jgi:hypothetical protein